MASSEEAKQALIDNIVRLTEQRPSASVVLMLAEAWAWLQSPGQPHGRS